MFPYMRPCVSLFGNDEKPWQDRGGELTNINTYAKSRAKNSGKIRIKPFLAT